MILPVIAFGHPILKKVAKPVDEEFNDLETFVESMWQTMYNAHGIGLAAPQIGQSVRIFIIDTVQVMEDEVDLIGIKRVFINPEKISENGDEWPYEEGCLSIPNIRGEVKRPKEVTLKYQDMDFKTIEETFNGVNARVIQHEYDHLQGKLFLDYLKPVKKRLIKRKLEGIKKGAVDADYKMKFYRL